jgi:hypothetical protein
LVTRESEQLSGCCGDNGKVAEHSHEDDECRQDRGASVGLGGIEEDLDIWLPSWRVDNTVHVSKSHAESDNQHQTHCSIDECGPDHGPRYLLGCIFELFRHVDRGVRAQQWNHHSKNANKG